MKKFARFLLIGSLCGVSICCSLGLNPGAEDSGGAYTTITVGPGGGVFDIDGTATITFPQDAVSTDTQLRVRCLRDGDWGGLFDNYGQAAIEPVCGFEIIPASLQFGEAPEVRFASLGCDPTTIPLVHAADLSAGAHVVGWSRATMDHSSDWLTVEVLSAGAYVVEANHAWANAAPPPGGAVKGLACREGLIIVETSDSDLQCTFQDCQITESTVSVQFMSCPGQPVESATLREASVSCAPVIELAGQASTVGTNATLPVAATVKVGCKEIPGQEVDFSVVGPATIDPGERETDEHGIATTTLSSGDQEGFATVTCDAMVRYPVREIIINGVVEEGFYRKEPESASVTIPIRDLPTWHVALDVALDEADHHWPGYFEHVTYSAHVEADVALEMVDDSRGYVDVNATQVLGEIAVEPDFPDEAPYPQTATVTDTYAPSPFPCRIFAYYDSDSVHFTVTHRGDDAEFATWEVEITYKYTGMVSHGSGFISGFFGCDGPGVTFNFPADPDTYSSSGCMTTVVYDGTYALTVSRIN
ncbi:MAG: hypothetical protein JW820_03225 [Spirochaetales bacterium]|nr:hypothetical protein [Spirochaetales bacterium]